MSVLLRHVVKRRRLLSLPAYRTRECLTVVGEDEGFLTGTAQRYVELVLIHEGRRPLGVDADEDAVHRLPLRGMGGGGIAVVDRLRPAAVERHASAAVELDDGADLVQVAHRAELAIGNALVAKRCAELDAVADCQPAFLNRGHG